MKKDKSLLEEKEEAEAEEDLEEEMIELPEAQEEEEAEELEEVTEEEFRSPILKRFPILKITMLKPAEEEDSGDEEEEEKEVEEAEEVLEVPEDTLDQIKMETGTNNLSIQFKGVKKNSKFSNKCLFYLSSNKSNF